jgi:hypothetical protein
MFTDLKEGAFTKQAKDAGMGVQEFAAKVLANPKDYNATTVKRANFAKNVKGIANKKKKNKTTAK